MGRLRYVRKALLFVLPLALVITAGFMLTACSPFYVLRAAYEESKILLAREDIEELVQSGSPEASEQEKLSLVLRARAFAEQIGLTPKDSFTKYSKVDRDILAWVLLASEKTSFSIYTWWYPIVGTVPYKGYFNKESAECAARRLEREGYETWVRGTEAISTLGWFNDPILSTTLSHPTHRVANTVIHEILHSTIWIPDHVDFNESAANFVGYQGAIQFFEQELATCSDQTCTQEQQELLKQAEQSRLVELEFARIVNELHDRLEELYTSSAKEELKLTKRDEIFHELIDPLRAKYPKMRAFKKLNNAEIMQQKLYLTDLPLFEDTFTHCKQQWDCVFDRLREVKTAVEDEKTENPFDFLRSAISH